MARCSVLSHCYFTLVRFKLVKNNSDTQNINNSKFFRDIIYELLDRTYFANKGQDLRDMADYQQFETDITVDDTLN